MNPNYFADPLLICYQALRGGQSFYDPSTNKPTTISAQNIILFSYSHLLSVCYIESSE